MLQITLDPKGKHVEYSEDHIKSMLGLIPNFILQAQRDMEIEQYSFAEAMEKQYGWPAGKMEGTVVDGVYSYPSDPDLYPLAEYNCGEGITLYQYEYGIIAYVEPDKTTIVRMD